MTLLFKYDDSASSILTLSENSSQEDLEICFLSDQSETIMKDIWSLYMYIYTDSIVTILSMTLCLTLYNAQL